MNDQELIECAAKAAGVSGQFLEDGGFWLNGERTPDNSTDWNPLLRDGDALRLAVAIQLELTVFRDHVTAYYATGWCDELNAGNPQAATRRAIVRAAAEIGKAL